MTSLRVAATHPACTVLGPGTRFAVWVQGCPLRCTGCVSPQWLPFDGGTEVAAAVLTGEIMATPGIEGVTFSGGEPFAQAAALAEVAEGLRAAGLSTMAYSGFTLRRLRRGTPAQRRLLAALDVLVDGPYVAARHADLRWRASTNQHVRFLTGRYAHLRDAPDRSAGIQVEITPGRELAWLGVPPVPGFAAGLVAELAARGVTMEEAHP